MFKFRLQTILELRARNEERTAAQLADSRHRADEARAEKRSVEDALSAGLARIASIRGAPSPVGEMRSRAYVLAQLDERVARASVSVARAEETVRKDQEEYTLAFRERRVLDRLRERREEEWRAEEERTELTAMDGVALARFTSAATSAAAQEEAS